LMTAGLLASASFLIIAVEAFQQAPRSGEGRKDSGTGGFTLVAEADIPVTQVPPLSAGTTLYGFRLRPGDDVSCLNLYQPQQPRLLGVPQALIERGGFRFASLWEPSSEQRQNPWLLLNHRSIDEAASLRPGDDAARPRQREVPVFADATTAE